MPRKTLDIVFPTAGVVRRLGLRASTGGRGPFPTPWATNCRLEDEITDRLRGGSFVGISAGSRPTEIRYQDRLLTFSTNAITGTRMGDDTDTTHSADVSDTRRPALFQLSYGGATGGDVVALIPHKDSFLLGFTADETWVQQSNPLIHPRRQVSDEVGIIGADAWCKKDDTVYFMSSNGLYSIGADGSGLKALSEDKVPDDLTGVSDSTCKLTYQHSDRGVYIHFATDPGWFYDTARDSFWPFDTSTTNSHVLLGPFRLGGPNNYGRVLSIQGTVAQDSEGVMTWRLVTGASEEEAAANGKLAITEALDGDYSSSHVQARGTWAEGRNHIAYPKTRAMAAVLWLSAYNTWAYESVSLEAMLSGKWR